MDTEVSIQLSYIGPVYLNKYMGILQVFLKSDLDYQQVVYVVIS